MRPTLPELIRRSVSDLDGRLEGAFPFRSKENAWARAIACAYHQLYGYGEGIQRRALPDRALALDLRRWTSDFGVVPAPSTKSAGDVVVETAGVAVISEGHRFTFGGRTYTSDADHTWLVAGDYAAGITAAEPGAEHDIPLRTPALHMGWDPPDAGAIADVLVDIEAIDGGYVESDEALRSRQLAAMRDPTETGRLDDYVRWAFEAPLVPASGSLYRAWAKRALTTPGQIQVWVVNAPPAVGVTPASLAIDIGAYIATKLPIGDTVQVSVPAANTVDVSVQITPPGAPAPSAQQIAAVETAIEALFWTRLEPGDGAGAGAIYRWQLEDAALAAGGPNASVSLPATDVVPLWGTVNVPGTITVT